MKNTGAWIAKRRKGLILFCQLLAVVFSVSALINTATVFAEEEEETQTQEEVLKPLVSTIVTMVNETLNAEENTQEEESLPGKPWPEWEPEGEDTKPRELSDPEQRYPAYFGPDRSYPDAGSYLPGTMRSTRVLFREGDYVLVDMDYRTAGKRCLYFKASIFPDCKAEEVELTGCPARTAAALMPMQGPGAEYEQVTQTKESKYADYTLEELVGKFGGSLEIYEATKPQKYSVVLDEGTEIRVFFETKGWVFAEFECEMGLVRAWLPADYVEPF